VHLLDDALLRLQVGLTPRENTRADDQRFRSLHFRGGRRALASAAGLGKGERPDDKVKKALMSF